MKLPKIPDELKTELYQLIFWSIVFGIVLVGIVLLDELKSLIGA